MYSRRSRIVSAVELEARIGTVTTREPFVIARGTEEENEVLWVEIRQDGVTGCGEAAPIPRYDESAAVGAGLCAGGSGGARRRPVRARGDHGAAARARVRRARRDRRRAARPAGQARRTAGLPAARARTSRPTDLVDDLARRPRRHGAARRSRRRPIQAPQAEDRRRRRSRRRPCARGARGRRRAAPGRRERGVERGRGARRAAAARGARRRVLRAAAPGRRSRGADGEGRARRSRSTSTRTATRCAMSLRAPSARTAST